MPATMKSAKQLREERNQIAKNIEQLRNQYHEAGQQFTSEQQEQWDKANKDFDAKSEEIRQAEAAEEIDKRHQEVQQALNQNQNNSLIGRNNWGQSGGDGATETITEEHRALALQSWFLKRTGRPLSNRHREACRLTGFNPRSKFLNLNFTATPIYRKMQSVFRRSHPSLVNDRWNELVESRDLLTSGGAGGTIPQGFVNALEKAMLYFGPMMMISDVITTASGNALPWPTVNDTGNTGRLLSEAGAITLDTDPTFSSVTFNAYKYSSDAVQVSVEMLEDSAFDLAQVLGELLGERLGRIINTHCTTGTGSSQPNGIITAATTGKTTASATAITADEVIDLYYSVDPMYRPNGSWMAHNNIWAAVRKLKGSDNNYLWQPGLMIGQPDMLLGAPVYTNNDMASAITTGLKTMLFGDVSKYKIRRVQGIRLRRLVERYADNDLEAFIAFTRADGDLLNAGTNPVKIMVQA